MAATTTAKAIAKPTARAGRPARARTAPSAPRIDVRELRALERKGEYDVLIRGLRERIHDNRRVLTNGWVKGWCGRRWRDLFLTEAAKDERAVSVASRRVGVRGTPLSVRIGPDKRPFRQRIAERFLTQDIDDWKLELPPGPRLRKPKTTLLFCPGFVNTFVPVQALAPELAILEEAYGMRVLRARAHPVRGCEANMVDIMDAIERGRGLDAIGEPIERPRKPKDFFMLGYSKGTPDALTVLANHPELAPRVRSLVCWAGAVGGSYSADDVYGAIKDLRVDLGPASTPVLTLIKALLPVAQLEGLIERSEEWDLKTAVRDLTTTERARFLRRHAKALDELDIPIFNVVTVAGPLEVPFFQVQASIDIGRKSGPNDMQVAVPHSQMTTPMATTLAVLHAHHWDLAMEPFPQHMRLGSPNLDHPFPRLAAVVATVLLQAELGLVD
jgi:hypothetical protein